MRQGDQPSSTMRNGAELHYQISCACLRQGPSAFTRQLGTWKPHRTKFQNGAWPHHWAAIDQSRPPSWESERLPAPSRTSSCTVPDAVHGESAQPQVDRFSAGGSPTLNRVFLLIHFFGPPHPASRCSNRHGFGLGLRTELGQPN